MRKQIAAANWKMNLTYVEGQKLLSDILETQVETKENDMIIFAVPFPYLMMANEKVNTLKNHFAAAQNCSVKKSGAYTGEISVDMLKSISIQYCIIGHSECREHFAETNEMLAQKISLLIEKGLTPIFCCGESLIIREANTQNDFVENQLKESLFHLSEENIKKIIIAYEPIWAIGTGKTATTAQAQEMHAHLRAMIAAKYSETVANEISILYGGSVNPSNAKELFSSPDVDGGLVGGASLIALDFVEIIKVLK